MPGNVSRHLRERAKHHPEKIAVILPSGKCLTFRELDAECDHFARVLSERGVRPGMRVAVFVRPGLSFVPTIFGCFRLGAVPVFIDPGMKWKDMLKCVKESAPEALVGISRALFLARLFPKAFSSVRIRLAAPRGEPGRVRETAFVAHPTSGEDTAAILFTSGSTGVPKGVVYTHAAFDAQQRLLRETYGIGEEETDLVVFPLFALFSAAWGITAVIPHMNPARPARASGKHLAFLIRRFRVTHTAGSPAIWKNLSDYCLSNGVDLPSLNRILMAGAQVPEKLVKACTQLAREVHTPYGATEALPLTTISHTELFTSYDGTRTGAGTCVGRPLAGVDIAILPLQEGPISDWNEGLRLSPLEKGEITVRAPWVTREYFRRESATSSAKIASPLGVWHRMGDVGYLDAQGRVWFCGRKDHRIFAKEGTLFPDPIEAIFDNHPDVPRSAVVGVGAKGTQTPVLVVAGARKSKKLGETLRKYAEQFPAASALRKIVFLRRLPVDVRHNIKIDRPLLARLIEGDI